MRLMLDYGAQKGTPSDTLKKNVGDLAEWRCTVQGIRDIKVLSGKDGPSQTMDKDMRDLVGEVSCSIEETSMAAVRVNSGRIMQTAGRMQGRPDQARALDVGSRLDQEGCRDGMDQDGQHDSRSQLHLGEGCSTRGQVEMMNMAQKGPLDS